MKLNFFFYYLFEVEYILTWVFSLMNDRKFVHKNVITLVDNGFRTVYFGLENINMQRCAIIRILVQSCSDEDLFSIFFFRVYDPTRNFFTDMETSPLPLKDCNFLSLLGRHGHCAVRVLKRVSQTVTRGIHYYGNLWGPLTLTPIAEQWSCHYLF